MTVDVGGETLTLYTRAEAAALLGVTERTMTDYVRRGRIATVLVDRHRLIPAWALKAYLIAADRRPRRDGSGGRKESTPEIFENEETLF